MNDCEVIGVYGYGYGHGWMVGALGVELHGQGHGFSYPPNLNYGWTGVWYA